MKQIIDEIGAAKSALTEGIAEILKLGKYVLSAIVSAVSVVNLVLFGTSFLVVSLFHGYEAGSVLILSWYLEGLIPAYIHVASAIGGPGGAAVIYYGLKKDGII